MAFAYYNPNPVGLHVRDCTVRALCAVLGIGWDEAHELLSDTSRKMGLMPSNKKVMWSILMRKGFIHEQLPDLCPDCYKENQRVERDRGKGSPVCVSEGLLAF